MNAQFTIPARVLLGVNMITDDNLVRYRFRSTLIEKTGTTVKVIASNGHYMGVYTHEDSDATGDDGTFAVSLFAWKDYGRKIAKEIYINAVLVAVDGENVTLKHPTASIELPVSYNDVYPWATAIPKETDVPIPSIGLDAAYLMTIRKAFVTASGMSAKDAAKDTGMFLSFTSQMGVMTITSGVCPEFTAYLMPVRLPKGGK